MSAALPITDLTVGEFGDVNIWIGQGRRYQNVPEYIAKELCRRTSALPTETSLLPSPQLPVLHLLDFPTPPVTPSLKDINAEAMFSSTIATHTSSECLQLLVPSPNILKALKSCAGQAMLDGKTSVQHWDKRCHDTHTTMIQTLFLFCPIILHLTTPFPLARLYFYPYDCSLDLLLSFFLYFHHSLDCAA